MPIELHIVYFQDDTKLSFVDIVNWELALI